jgi:hypothetical protein
VGGFRASDFVQHLERRVEPARERRRPYVATVVTRVDADWCIVQRPEDTVAPTLSTLVLNGFGLRVGDRVLVLPLDDEQAVVLGRIGGGSGQLVQGDGISFTVYDETGQAWATWDSATHTARQFASADGSRLATQRMYNPLGNYTTNLHTGTATTGGVLQLWNFDRSQNLALDGSDGSLGTWGPVVGGSFNSPVWSAASQDAGDTVSSTVVGTYVTAQSLSLVLPTGTWTVTALGWLSIQHSANGNCAIRIGLAGTAAGVSQVAPSTSFTVLKYARTVTGQSGTVTATLEYQPTVAGTATVDNPMLLLLARRTA